MMKKKKKFTSFCCVLLHMLQFMFRKNCYEITNTVNQKIFAADKFGSIGDKKNYPFFIKPPIYKTRSIFPSLQ